MAYSAVDNTNLAAGKAVITDSLVQLNNNVIDHESRINSLEGGAAVIEVINELVINAARMKSTATIEGLVLYQAQKSFTFGKAVVTVLDGISPTSGTLQIDVQKSTSPTSGFATVFSTKPSVAFGDAPGSSTNAIFSTTAVTAGDWIRVDVTGFLEPQPNFQFVLTGDL